MKPYGVPRYPDVECPDKVDITVYGLAPHRHGEKRRSSVKRWARRRWKKVARKLNKLLCKEIDNGFT